MSYKSLLLEGVEVELHFHLAEKLGDGGHNSAEKSRFKETMVVDLVSVGVRLRCSYGLE